MAIDRPRTIYLVRESVELNDIETISPEDVGGEILYVKSAHEKPWDTRYVRPMSKTEKKQFLLEGSIKDHNLKYWKDKVRRSSLEGSELDL